MKALLVLWGLVVLRHAILLAVQTFFLILLGQRGADYLSGSLTLFAFLLIGVLGGVLGGHFSDRWGRWPVIVWSFWTGFPAMIGSRVVIALLNTVLWFWSYLRATSFLTSLRMSRLS